jgi:outer membrane protein OmpA-like peptidoglycan-associated protein
MKSTLFIFLLATMTCFGQKQFEVFFDFNQDFPNQQSILSFNQWISENKKIEVMKLFGYCDSVDTKNYNKRLAERRIENVFHLLEKSGIEIHKNVENIAYGKDFKQSKIQAENRKVIIFYKEKEEEQKEVISELTKQIREAKAGETIKLPNIYFYNNSARTVPKSQTTLYDLLCAMEENPNLKIEIQGHICCQTVNDINDISTARAKAIYNFLIRNKISRERMTFKGFGTTKPVHKIPEKNETEADENRRVEVLIIEN